jgi:hypothetical protein
MANKVKMTAARAISVTSVQSEPLREGEEFEVNADEAKELEERGLASRSGSTRAAKSK